MRNIVLAALLLLPIGISAGNLAVDESKPIPPEATAASKVDGLELPPDQTVGNDEGFVNISAKCGGQVKWLVVSAGKVKYVPIPQNNSIIISVPPSGGVISVFAVGLVDGRLTDFARTNITVGGKPGPTPPGPKPGPGPGPSPLTGPLHVTFLVDMTKDNATLAQLLNSQSLRQAITSKGNYFRVYDMKSPIVAEKKFDKEIAKVGGAAIVVVQRSDGTLLVSTAIPSTEAAILDIIEKAGLK